MLLVLTMLTCLSILFFAINVVEAVEQQLPIEKVQCDTNAKERCDETPTSKNESASADLDETIRSDSIRPKTGSSTQDEAESDREITKDSIMTETQNEGQVEEGFDVKDKELFPTEMNYCNVNLVGQHTSQGYTIKTGTNNDDKLIGMLIKI